MKQTTQNIPDGYKQTVVGIIPEDWEVKKIDKIGKIVGGGTPSTSNDSFWNGNINWFTPTEIKSKYTDEESSRKITEKGLSNSSAKLLPKNTILLTTRATIGEASIATKECCTNQGFQSIICNSNTSYLFLYDLINYNRKELIRKANGSTFLEISKDEIKKIKLPIPPLPEQEKIADCLTTWDAAIEKLSELIKAKKQYKKGLVQQFFNEERAINNNYLEFKLGDLGATFNGLTDKTKDDFGEGQPYVTYLNTFNQNKIDKNTKFDFVKISELENQTSLKYGDLIFTTSSETPNEVGMSSVILFQPNENLYLNSFCFGLRLSDFSKLKPEYAVFLLRCQSFRKEMYKLAQGSTRFNLSKTGFKKIKINLPFSEEQAAIAEILSTADKEIRLLEEKLVSFKTQKKGLMQVLLTGKKRLV